MARAQRVSFSAEEGGGADGSKNKLDAQAGMDAETRRSIGEGDKKSEKSMKTVKVGTRMMRQSNSKIYDMLAELQYVDRATTVPLARLQLMTNGRGPLQQDSSGIAD